jgi:hypothetical protein
MKIIAEFNDYPGFLDAMRLRAQQRQIAISGDVNDIAMLPDAYLAKLLAPRPVRRIGAISLGPVLQVLGVKLVMVEDEKALRWIDARLGKSKQPFVHSGAITQTLSRRFMQKIGRNGAQLRWANHRKAIQVKKRISAMKRKAVMVRWHDARARWGR